MILRLLLVMVFGMLSSSVYAQIPSCEGAVGFGGTELKRTRLVNGLQRPVDVTAPDGDFNRVFVVEQEGRIKIVDLNTNEISGTFLDITDRVSCCGEEGLLGLAFHPNYDQNGYFYVYYILTGGCGADNQAVVARFSVRNNNPNQADVDSEEIIFTQCQPDQFHNGGKILFGPRDGYLYIVLGDSGEDEQSQSGQSFLGKMLRIDVDADSPYGIPPSNPFVNNNQVKDEIFALGLRNPWRFGFDSSTGDILIGDVGQTRWEELNLIPRGTSGQNFGWPIFEGRDNNDGGVSQGPGTLTEPVYVYPNTRLNNPNENPNYPGASVIGGVVYRGCAMPEIRGTYLFTDWQGKWFQSFNVNGSSIINIEDRTGEMTDQGRVTSFGTDARGEIYMCAQTQGALYKVELANPTAPIVTFVRGDVNNDKWFDIGDPVTTLFKIYVTGNPFLCEDAADTNDDGQVDLSDVIYSLSALFLGEAIPEDPFPTCGIDPTEDNIMCAETNC